MTRTATRPIVISTAALVLASCGVQATGETPVDRHSSIPANGAPFAVTAHGGFDEPWAARFAPGTGVLFVTEKRGTMKFVDTASGRLGTVSGVPEVAYGGQGGFGDVAFLQSEAASTLGTRTIYLTWAERGPGNTRGAALGRGKLVCAEADACRIEGLTVIWRQEPKVTGRGQYAHRIAFSPDGKYLFVASGDRQHPETAQQPENNLGSVVRLNLDGTPAPGNPAGERPGWAPDVWSIGHRNQLGLQFDAQGRLWDLEHGPAGGDELNLVERGRNYGWPLVSGGDNYNGTPIPRNESRPDLAQPAIAWTPVIAPGDFLFYSGKLWPEWKGQAIIAGLKTEALIRVGIEGTRAKELARHPFGHRMREVVEAPDGALWVLEDGPGGRLLELRPRR